MMEFLYLECIPGGSPDRVLSFLGTNRKTGCRAREGEALLTCESRF